MGLPGQLGVLIVSNGSGYLDQSMDGSRRQAEFLSRETEIYS